MKMNRKQIEEKLEGIKSKMMLIEQDRRRSHTFSKDDLYEQLKEEYKNLEKELNDETKKKWII